jgi:hypothetical protein
LHGIVTGVGGVRVVRRAGLCLIVHWHVVVRVVGVCCLLRNLIKQETNSIKPTRQSINQAAVYLQYRWLQHTTDGCSIGCVLTVPAPSRL